MTDGMRIYQEEVFGPFVVISSFETEDEALRRANNTAYGLGSAVFTKDLVRAHRVARGVEAGMVWVNSNQDSDFRVPFGGKSLSGSAEELLPHHRIGQRFLRLERFMSLPPFGSTISWIEAKAVHFIFPSPTPPLLCSHCILLRPPACTFLRSSPPRETLRRQAQFPLTTSPPPRRQTIRHRARTGRSRTRGVLQHESRAREHGHGSLIERGVGAQRWTDVSGPRREGGGGVDGLDGNQKSCSSRFGKRDWRIVRSVFGLAMACFGCRRDDKNAFCVDQSNTSGARHFLSGLTTPLAKACASKISS